MYTETDYQKPPELSSTNQLIVTALDFKNSGRLNVSFEGSSHMEHCISILTFPKLLYEVSCVSAINERV